MKLIKPSFEILEQGKGTDGMLEHIELCGRTCYKSEPEYEYYDPSDRPEQPLVGFKTKEGINVPFEEAYAEGILTRKSTTSKKFVDMIIKRGHTAMLEHGTVYLKWDMHIEDYSDDGQGRSTPNYASNPLNKYKDNQYSEYLYLTKDSGYPYYKDTSECYVTTNYRVLLQNGWLDDLQYQCEPTEHHTKRITVKFICDRGVSHEFVRHRVFSFAQESTRFCNYIKAKFGGSVSFITPPWLNEEEELNEFEQDLKIIEAMYFKWLQKGWTAQQARGFLCNFLKTELVVTGTIEQWEGFFELRDAKDAHPQARELAEPLHAEFIKKGWVNN